MSSSHPAAIDADLLCTAAGKAAGVLKVLANKERLLLLLQLSRGEMCVGELEEALNIHQPTLSQQLCVLRTERLVGTRREGKRIYYHVADASIGQLLEVLYRIYLPRAASTGQGLESTHASITFDP